MFAVIINPELVFFDELAAGPETKAWHDVWEIPGLPVENVMHPVAVMGMLH